MDNTIVNILIGIDGVRYRAPYGANISPSKRGMLPVAVVIQNDCCNNFGLKVVDR